MAITRKLVASGPATINSTHGKTCLVKVIPRGGDTFVNPDKLTVKSIEDKENKGLKFTPSVVASKTHATQAVLKLVTVNPKALGSSSDTSGPRLALIPTDGLLTITLTDTAADFEVCELPVTYVDDSDNN